MRAPEAAQRSLCRDGDTRRPAMPAPSESLALVSASPPTPPDTRLHGRWLLLARVGWVAVYVAIIVMNIIAIPDVYGANFVFTPQALQDLHQHGLSPTLY